MPEVDVLRTFEEDVKQAYLSDDSLVLDAGDADGVGRVYRAVRKVSCVLAKGVFPRVEGTKVMLRFPLENGGLLRKIAMDMKEYFGWPSAIDD